MSEQSYIRSRHQNTRMIILDEEVSQIANSQLQGLLGLVILATLPIIIIISVILNELLKRDRPSNLKPIAILSALTLTIITIFTGTGINDAREEAEEFLHNKITTAYIISVEEEKEIIHQILKHPLTNLPATKNGVVVVSTTNSVLLKSNTDTFVLYRKATPSDLIEYQKRR